MAPSLLLRSDTKPPSCLLSPFFCSPCTTYSDFTPLPRAMSLSEPFLQGYSMDTRTLLCFFTPSKVLSPPSACSAHWGFTVLTPRLLSPYFGPLELLHVLDAEVTQPLLQVTAPTGVIQYTDGWNTPYSQVTTYPMATQALLQARVTVILLWGYSPITPMQGASLGFQWVPMAPFRVAHRRVVTPGLLIGCWRVVLGWWRVVTHWLLLEGYS